MLIFLMICPLNSFSFFHLNSVKIYIWGFSSSLLTHQLYRNRLKKKKKKNTQYKTLLNAHNKKTAGRKKLYFSSDFFLATVTLGAASVVPTQLQEKTR